MKTVLFVTDSLAIGGAEAQLFLLVKYLPKEWKPVIFSLSVGPYSSQYSNLGIKIVIAERKSRYNLIAPKQALAKTIFEIKPNLIHSWSWMTAVLVYLTCVKKNIPHVAGTIRLGGLPGRRKILTKLAARLGDIAVANSLAGLKAWGLSEDSGKVIHNGFDWSKLDYSLSQFKYPKDKSNFIVTMIASFAERKDWRAFVDVAKYLSSSNPKIRFYGYGNGPLRNETMEYAQELISNGILFFPGKTDDPISACLSADIGILLSTFGEGISNTLTEFMACSRPVVCTNSGGNPELVIDGEVGFLVNSDNPTKQIAEKILWFYNNPKKTILMGKKAKDRIVKDFSTQKMVDSYIDIYNSLLSSSDTPESHQMDSK